MTINQMANLQFAQRSMYSSNVNATRSLNRLSSGYRINSAADNAAGLAISEKMRGQIGGLSKASENTQSAVSLIQTAEGSLNETNAILTRMKELSVQASNGTYSDSDRALLNREFQSLKGELDRIADSTQYNGINLLDGSLGGTVGNAGLSKLGVTGIDTSASSNSTANFTIAEDNGVYSITAQMNGETITNMLNSSDVSSTFTFGNGDAVTVKFDNVTDLQAGVIANVGVESGNATANTSSAVSATSDSQLYFQVGANGSADQRFGVGIGNMSSFGLGIHDLDISSVNGANSALSALENATNQVTSQRNSLGATQKRLEHTYNNLQTSHENMVKSHSTIRDTNYAKEIMNFMQYKVQQQASQAMMAQGMNISRQNMLSLLLR